MSDFQSLASRQGQHYEQTVRQVLGFRGWTVTNDRPVKVPGGEVDIIAYDPGGELWWIECKGSYRGQPGLERYDTVLKAVGAAWSLRQSNPDRPRYWLATNHLPKKGSAGDRLLALAVLDGLFTRVEVVV